MEASTAFDGLRVLIVGINYAPEHAGIGPYTSQLADHLALSGAEVRVVTGVPHYPAWRVDHPFRRWRTVEQTRRLRVERLCHFVPRRQSGVLRALYELSFACRVLFTKQGRPDVVVSVSPALLGAGVAIVRARVTRRPSIMWTQDLMGKASLQTGMSGGAAIAAAANLLERVAFRLADHMVVPSERFARYAARLGVPLQQITVIPNWPHVAGADADRDQTRRNMGWPEEALVVLHTGNMGLKQGLENVVEAARRAGSSAPELLFVLVGDGSQRGRIVDAAEKLPNMQVVPPVSAQSYPNVLAAADVLLISERSSVDDMSIPSKLASYRTAGIPIVAAVHPKGITADVVRNHLCGTLVEADRPDLLVATCQRVGADEQARSRAAAAAEDYRLEQGEQTGIASLASVILRSATRADRFEPPPRPSADS